MVFAHFLPGVTCPIFVSEGMTELDYESLSCWLKLEWNKDDELYFAGWTPPPSGGIWQQEDFEVMADIDRFAGRMWDEMIYYGPDQSADKFEEDEVVGLLFSYGDFDDPESPKQYHAYWTVNHQDLTFKFAERLCDFLVAPLEVEPAVEANTWDRIKASFK